MPSPGEHKTVQARILAYAQEIGWTFVSREEAERRRGFDQDAPTPEERARPASLFFGDLLHAKVRQFNPKYKEVGGALVGELQRLHSDIYGNRDFLTYLRNQRTFFSSDDNRELDLILIDYGDLALSPKDWRNRYEVTEEFVVHNGRHEGRCGLPRQRHSGAGHRMQEREQGRGNCARDRLDSLVPSRDARSNGPGDVVHRHRSNRLLLWRDLEHCPAEHLCLEARGSGAARGKGEKLLLRADGLALSQGFHLVC